jgi:hypothetical protein
MVLEELEIPYEIVTIRFEDVKKAPFIDVNPNGRAPGWFDETFLETQIAYFCSYQGP